MQLAELGTLETPVVLTNTLSVGTAATALVRHMLDGTPEIGASTGTVNPVVMECNDGAWLNDIRGLHVTEDEVLRSLAATGPAVAEGNVGAGRSEEHTSELPSLMRNSYAVFLLKKKHIN